MRAQPSAGGRVKASRHGMKKDQHLATVVSALGRLLWARAGIRVTGAGQTGEVLPK